MKLLYIAGPYRAKTSAEVVGNINFAWLVALEVVRTCPDVFPVVPHLNTQHMDGAAPDQYFLDGTMELLKRCDAILAIGDYRKSAGTLAELEYAAKKGMPMFQSVTGVKWWNEDGFVIKDDMRKEMER